MEESEKISRWRRLREQLGHTYRLVVMNDETFEEVGSYKLSLMNVYIALSSIVVVVALIVVSLIAFTPLKKYIPGYGDTVEREEMTSLYREVARMERELAQQQQYTDNVRNILVGEVETIEEVEREQAEMPDMVDTFEEVTHSSEEISLRREMDLEAVGESNRGEQSAPTAGSRHIPLEQMFFVAPVRGEISASFKPAEDHHGVDILAPKNTAIKAATDGYVFLSDWTLETGNTIGIQHGNDVITFYKHNAELLKKVGSYVKSGEAVAIIGNTGTLSTGPHLHFELWYNGRPVDPTLYIKF